MKGFSWESGMETEKQLFGLLALAEEQQKTIATALEGLARERAALAQAASSAASAVEAVKRTVAEVGPSLQAVVGDGVRSAMQRALAGVPEAVATSLQAAGQPLVGRLAEVVTSAGEAESRLRRAVAGFGWKWLALVFSATVAGLLVMALGAWTFTVWQQRDVAALAVQKQALSAEVAELQAGADKWAKKAGRATLTTCGEKKRLCVTLDTGTILLRNSEDKEGIYAVLQGY